MLKESGFSQVISFFFKFSKEYAVLGRGKWILTTCKMKWKNPSRLSMTHLTLNPLNTLPNNKDRRGRGNAQNPYPSIQNRRSTNGD